ncbi:GFA family protein [Roseovarius rhodophyticola]|uniref:GFA family protein n=1 Tax=Roseovarius rhodophyticola TaxID=3080827 RepID=A0ABZ2THR9_9RHOB|nr:GFA family protein [Roseovarius sp. W115]MDV2929558.1 GFA family protein [Roseovarius sp. W115]
MFKGSCLCGDVTFEVNAPAEGASVCHCGQCRKQSGHVWSSAHAAETAIHIAGPVHWYEASPAAKRGFCARCGSFLFWKAHDENTMSFALGALDGKTGLKLEKHIFTADKGDYYEIDDEVPQS